MSTLLTGVRFGVFICLTFYLVNSSADDNVSNCKSYQDQHIKIAGEQGRDSSEAQYWKREADNCLSKGSGGSCQEAKKEFNKSIGAFDLACSKARIKSDGSSGHIGCSSAVRSCDDVNIIDEVDTEADENGIPKIDAKLARLKYKHCPVLAKEDQAKFDEELKASQKEVDALDEKMNSLKKEQIDAEKGALEMANQFDDEEAAAEEDLENQIRDAQNSKDEALKAVQAQVAGLESQIIGHQDALRRLEVERDRIDLDYKNALDAINMGCRAQATAQTIEAMQREAGKINSKTANYKTAHELFGRVGKKDDDKWQDYAEQRYLKCRGTAETQTSRASAAKEKAFKLTANRSEVRNQEAAIAKIQKDMTQLRSTHCGAAATANPDGTSNETSACQAHRKLHESVSSFKATASKKMASLGKKRQRAEAAARKSAALTADQISKLSKKIEVEEARVRHFKKMLAINLSKGGVSKTAAEDIADVYIKLNTLRAQASEVAGSCSDPKDRSKAVKFIVAMGDEPDLAAAEIDTHRDPGGGAAGNGGTGGSGAGSGGSGAGSSTMDGAESVREQ